VHFCLQPCTSFTLILPLHIIYFLHLLSTNHKCTQPCYFPPAVQTCYSEVEEDLEYFDMVFRASDCPRWIACGVMVPFHCNASESGRLSLLYRHYSINILYIVTLVILYPFSVRYVCKLDSWAHIL
jgi:hypothetical protein